MRVIRILPNLPVADIGAAKGFYTDFLGLNTEEFNLGWVARYSSPHPDVAVQLVSGDASAPEDSVISAQVDDVDAAYAEAQRLGYEIVHPLTTEPWGVPGSLSVPRTATSSTWRLTAPEVDCGRPLPRRRGWTAPTGQRLRVWRYLLAIVIVAER